MIHSIGMSNLIRYIMLIPCCPGLVMVAGEEELRCGITSAAMVHDRYVLRIFLALFYADDAFIASHNHRILQEALDILVKLFERVGLLTNTAKTQTIICIPGKIRTRLTSGSYTRQYGGLTRAAEWSARVV